MERRKTRPGEAARAPLEQPVGLRFKHFDEFVEELSANVSIGGMFIRTSKPHPVGSVFEFELRLGEGAPLVAGKAQVVWSRRRSEEADRPVGMGVRFVELADESRRQILELVAAHEAPGGQRGEVDRDDGAADLETASPAERSLQEARQDDGAAPAGRSTPPPRGAAAEERRRPPSRAPWIALSLFLAAALIVSLWPRPAPPVTPAAEPPPEAPVAAAPPPAAAAAPLADEESDAASPNRAVRDWARSWSEQRVDDYLSFYSPGFRPEGGLDRAAWERRRRARILAPQWIEVGLAFVEVEETDDGRRRVSFVQAYESDSYRDVVRKVVVLERVDGAWKILRETVEP